MYSASGGAFSELYHANGANGYDNLNRLKEFRRGTLTGTDTVSDANTTYRQVFTLDVVGSWTEFKQDAGDVGAGGVYSPMILTRTRFLRRPSNSP